MLYNIQIAEKVKAFFTESCDLFVNSLCPRKNTQTGCRLRVFLVIDCLCGT